MHALGGALAVQAHLAALKESAGSSVVFFSSVAARQGFASHASVAMAKGAIEGLTLSLAAELDETGLGSARLLNPAIMQPRARFLALESPRARAWQDAFARAGVITDLRGDVLRIGVGLYHDEDDITHFCDIAASF